MKAYQFSVQGDLRMRTIPLRHVPAHDDLVGIRHEARVDVYGRLRQVPHGGRHHALPLFRQTRVERRLRGSTPLQRQRLAVAPVIVLRNGLRRGPGGKTADRNSQRADQQNVNMPMILSHDDFHFLYLAYSMHRSSRMTVTRIMPGNVTRAEMSRQISPASSAAS